ncbi:hypothetical protein TTHERM_00703930 (macronuclear) [Tetrahymena thermophila SB210]|uniref:Uncharacterized protein n=1 Tax=Tetrahymena thermophila (strain SB210) TaxID=312017 RepID=Q22GD0_TETTS|nr:hypothetical protein TTHERM_00703930 [Tetrahymena thermophila SB210]EAR84401.2 hypothetical protein TTHERM_00703930 [Tetrahymena thermophila SB210]|eukprot:XP_001032064.2 hypothetical protein TTHERM_00703930 [Tetrahymena thermophila SB210]
MSLQPTQSSRLSNLSQSRKIIKTQRSVTYKTINPTDKMSQSLEPETYVSPKSQPSVPQLKINSQMSLTPGSSKMGDSQIKDQQQQMNSNTSFQNRYPESQQNLRNQDAQSFVSNQGINNNTKKRSEMHILTPKDFSQNQSFVSSAVFQINSTIPISQQGYIQNARQNTQPIQSQQVQSVITYQRAPISNQQQPQQQEVVVQQQKGVQVDASLANRQVTDSSIQNNSSIVQSPHESRQNIRSSQSLQPSQPIYIAQQFQATQNRPYKFNIPLEKAQNMQYQNQAINTPLQSDRSIPASKPGISENRLKSQQSLQATVLPDTKQEQIGAATNQTKAQESIYSQQTNIQEKANLRGESAPPYPINYSAMTSLASSFQPSHQISQNNYLLQSNNDMYLVNNNLNTSVFNVVVNDQDGLVDQIKRGRIESQQQNSVSKNQSPDTKKGIQNSAFIDYSYKKSITDKVLAIQVQQTKLQFDEIPLSEIIGRPPLYEQQPIHKIVDKPIQNEQKDILPVSSPQFGSLSIPPQNQNIQVSQVPQVIDEIKMGVSSFSNAQQVDKNYESLQKENKETSQIADVGKSDKIAALQEVKLESIIQAQNITISELSQTNKRSSNRSSTVDPLAQKKEGSFTPSQAKLLEELKQEQKVRESVYRDKSQIDISSKILVVDQSNTKETSASGRSISSDPYKGLNSFSQKYDGIVGQQLEQTFIKDQKFIGNDLVKNYLNFGVPSQMVSSVYQNQNTQDATKQINSDVSQEETVKKTSKNKEEKVEQIIPVQIPIDNQSTTANSFAQNPSNYLLNNNIQVYATQISSLNNPILSTTNNSNGNTIPINNTNPSNNNPIPVENSFANNNGTSNNISIANNPSNNSTSNFVSNYISNLTGQQNGISEGANSAINAINSTFNQQYSSLSSNYQVQNNTQASKPVIDLSSMSTEDYIKYKQTQFLEEQRSKSEQPNKQLLTEFRNPEQITTTVTTFTTYKVQSPALLNQVNTRSSSNIISSIPQYDSYKPINQNNNNTKGSQYIASSSITNQFDSFKPTTQQLTQFESKTNQNSDVTQQNYTPNPLVTSYQQTSFIQNNVSAKLPDNDQKTDQIQTFERQNLHKEKLHSRQNSDEDVKKASKNQEIQQSQSLSNYPQLNNNNSFGIQKIQNDENQKQVKELVEEKRKLREVKSVDHLMVQRRFVDPQIEEEVKGWVNPIFEEFIRKNFSGGNYNEKDIQEFIKRSKSEIGLGANNSISSIYIEEQLKQLIEQQKKLIDQQNVQITLQNEVQKSQLFANSHMSSPHIYANKYNENILLQNQLNNSNTKSNSQLLGTLSSDNQLHHQSNLNLQNIAQLNQYQTSYQNHKNSNVSPLSQNSSAFHPFNSQPYKSANPSNFNGQDLRFYMNSSVAGSTTTDNHHRIVSCFDQVVEQQNIPIDYNLTQSGLHDDINKSDLKNQQNIFTTHQSISPVNAVHKEASLSQRNFLQNSSPFTPNQQQQNPLGSINSILKENSNKLCATAQSEQDNRQNLQLDNINPNDEELLIEDLTPFNNKRQTIERQEEAKQQLHGGEINQENIEGDQKYSQTFQSFNKNQNADCNSSQEAGTMRGNTDRQSSRIQHSQSMKTDQGCEDAEDEYENIPKYFSENNSVRDNRESNYSVNQNKQSKFQQNRADDSYSSSSPNLSDREEMVQVDEIQTQEKKVKKSANKGGKKIMNMSNDGKITEESYSNKNDGSQLTSLNINLYKLQNQQDNFIVGEYTPQNNQENESHQSLPEQNASPSPKSRQQNQENIYQTPNEKQKDNEKEDDDDILEEAEENQTQENNLKIADILDEQSGHNEEDRSQENQKLRISIQDAIPLEKVEEVDQEYHKEAPNNISDKKIPKKNKSEVQLQQSQLSKKPNIPRSSSSLAIQKSGSSLSLSKILRKSELSQSSESNLTASEFIKRSKQNLEQKRKESKESQDSGTFIVFQDIQQHVQDKIQKYNQKKVQQNNFKQDTIIEDLQSSRSNNNSAQKDQQEIQKQKAKQLILNEDLQKTPQNIFNILNNKASSLKKRSTEKQSPNSIRTPQKFEQNSGIKIDFQKIKSGSKEEITSSNNKEELKNSSFKQKGEVLKVQLKSHKELGIGSKSPKDTVKQQDKKKQVKADKTSVFNISQSTVKSPNQSQIQSPQSESLKATIKKLQEGGEEFNLNKNAKQTKKKEKQQEQKVFILHKNQTFEASQSNTQKPISRHNTDQPIESKSSQFKKLTDSDRKNSPSYKITLSTQGTSDRNKISITPVTQNTQTKVKSVQKEQSQPLQVKISGKNITKEQQNLQTSQNQKFASSSTLNDNDQNTLNLYQRYQEKKIQDKELSTSQVFQRKKSINSNQNSNQNINVSQTNQEQEYQTSQSLKSPENIYQQNQNLRFQQQQYLNNQTKQIDHEQNANQNQQSQIQSQKQQPIYSSSKQSESPLQLKNQSQLQAYKQKQKEQLEKIESKLQQEEQEYQVLINSQTQPTIDATIMKSGKHLSPSQSEQSASQTVNRLFTSNPTLNTNKNLATNISQQQMQSQSSYSNNLNSHEVNYTQDYEDYLYQEYIKDQRELMIQKNIQEGINSGQLTEEQQKYLQELEQENRMKFQEFMKRNVEWVQEKERKIREWQQQKANLEMQECTFKPLINSQSSLDNNKPVYVPSTKSSRLLEEQNKLKINSQQNSINQISSQKSIKKSLQASRVGSNTQIQDPNVSRKFSNHSSNKMVVGIYQQNSPPSANSFANQYDRSTLQKQGTADLKQDIEDVLGILKNLSKPQ